MMNEPNDILRWKAVNWTLCSLLYALYTMSEHIVKCHRLYTLYTILKAYFERSNIWKNGENIKNEKSRPKRDLNSWPLDL